jgi:oligo-1,6-glucosidase
VEHQLSRKRELRISVIVPILMLTAPMIDLQHDRGRSVTRYASDHRVASAKMLAIYLLTQSGTPFIYQGEEIGTINAPIDYPIEDYMDTESIQFWAWVNETYKDDPATIQRAREGLQLTARDHSRMPMQWSDTANGGFTSAAATPWQKMNPCYVDINVESQIDDPASVLQFYKAMLGIRRKYPELFAYGKFTMLEKEDEDTMIWIKDAADGSQQQAVVALNFTSGTKPFTLPKDLLKGDAELVLSSHQGSEQDTLQAYEGRLYLVNVKEE